MRFYPIGFLIAMLILTASAFSQRGPAFEPRQRVKVQGEVVGQDNFSPRIYVENSPPTQFFIVRITKRIAGSETGNFVLVVHRPYDPGFIKAVGKGKRKFKLKLIRSTCDSSISGLRQYVPKNGSSDETVSPVKWFKDNLQLSHDTILPCYALIDAGSV